MSPSSKLFFYCLLSLFLPILSQNSPPSLIIDLFRHGNRGPMDNTWDPTWLPSEFDQLTPAGMRQQYVLGRIEREEYTKRFGDEFLVNSFDPKKVYVRSTNTERTIMSALAHLYGLFEGEGDAEKMETTSVGLPPFANKELIDKINLKLKGTSTLPFQYLPFPVFTVSNETDKELLAEYTCSSFEQWRQENINSEAFKHMMSRFQTTFDILETEGFVLNDWESLKDFADTLIVDHNDNRTLPGVREWNSSVIQDIIFLYNWGSVFTRFGQEKQRQTLATPLLNSVLEMIEGSINGSLNKQLVVLSGHDSSLLTFLTGLGIVTADCLKANFLNMRLNGIEMYPNCQYPNFAASVRIEVYKENEDYIRLFYNGNEVNLCENNCTYKEFEKIIKEKTNNTRIGEYDLLCNNTRIEGVLLKGSGLIMKQLQEFNVMWLFGGIMVLIVIFNIWEIRKCVKESRKRNKRRFESLIHSLHRDDIDTLDTIWL